MPTALAASEVAELVEHDQRREGHECKEPVHRVSEPDQSNTVSAIASRALTRASTSMSASCEK